MVTGLSALPSVRFPWWLPLLLIVAICLFWVWVLWMQFQLLEETRPRVQPQAPARCISKYK